MVEFEMYPAGVKIFLTAGGNVKLMKIQTNRFDCDKMYLYRKGFYEYIKYRKLQAKRFC